MFDLKNFDYTFQFFNKMTYFYLTVFFLIHLSNTQQYVMNAAFQHSTACHESSFPTACQGPH